MSTGPNLILGMVDSVGWPHLRLFTTSLERTGFEGEVRIFTAGLTPETRTALEQHGYVVERYRRLPRKLTNGHWYSIHSRFLPAVQWLYPRATRLLSSASRDRLRARGRLTSYISPPTVARFALYYDFLKTTETAYGNVMLTDVTDVYFQRDPFEFEVGDGINCFLEDETYRLSQIYSANANWIRIAFGDRGLQEIGSNLISCAAISIGPRNAMLAYLEVMVSWLTRLRRQVPGIDQAVHNYLVHKGLVPRLELHRNEHGPVLTMGLMESVQPQDLVDRTGQPFNVLHQYNRHPAIVELLQNRADTGRD